MRKRYKLLSVILGACLCFGCGCTGGGTESGTSTGSSDSSGNMREFTNHAVFDAVSLPDELWQTPETLRSEKDDRPEDARIQSYYMRSDYNGAESYAFAYLGVPDGASENNKKPAVLLIHGGAGSAYWHWVKNWVDRGYVALALDFEGHVPQKTATMDSPYTELYVKSEYPAPNNQNYNDSKKPIEQTWMYYAVQTAILGNSMLHSLPYVDVYNVGVCGVSWGSVITSIITGYDDRFAFSVPIYCAVGLKDDYGLISDCYAKNPDALVWDNADGIKAVNTPIYFVLPNNDFSMSPLPASRLYEECKNAKLTLYRGVLHSQSIAAAMFEVYDFADEIVTGRQKLIKINTQPDANGAPVSVTVPEGSKLDSAVLMYISEEPANGVTWSRQRCQIAGDIITYSVPENAKYFYIAAEDDFGRVVATKIVTL